MPGAEGSVTIEFKSSGFGGGRVAEKAWVTTNDPEMRKFELRLEGLVEAFVTWEPSRLDLSGKAGETITGEIRIVPRKDRPFRIVDAQIRERNRQDIAFRLEPLPGGAYLVKVENLRKLPGSYFAKITLTTDSETKPTLVLGVKGEIR